jgi:hypothetical protein
MQINHPDNAPDYGKLSGKLRPGGGRRVLLLSGEDGALDNYRLTYTSGPGEESETDSFAPRHRHSFDQFRYVINGDYSIAEGTKLVPGQVSYHPESAFYGPAVAIGEVEMVVLQFGGSGGNGFPSIAEKKKGMAILAEQGKVLENGYVTWTDEEGKRHNQDSYEAMWEAVNGRKITYVPPRYESPVVMNPDAYSFVPDEDNPGVERKILCTFTERNTKVGFIRVAKGATLAFGTEPSNENAFVTKGSIEYLGTVYPVHTAFGTAPTERPQLLTATEDAELFYIKLPTF